MAEFDNELRGVLFKNAEKQSHQSPDYKGSCVINGVEYWISSWIKEGQKGKFMSLSFKVKESNSKTASKAPPKTVFDFMPDDLPF